VRQARLLFDWDMEHERGIDAQERLRLIYDRPAVEGEWAAQRRLIAVLLWRAAPNVTSQYASCSHSRCPSRPTGTQG